MKEDLIKIIVDKGLLSLIILIAGYWLNKYLEINKQATAFRNKIKESNREKALSTTEKQLANFYYPIYFRLQKDNAIWRLSPQLSNKQGKLPIEANEVIENEFILKNHREIIAIIENNIQFIEVNEELQAAINMYIKHFTVYDVVRKTEALKHLNPIDFDAPFPKKFEKIIKNNMNILQQSNNELLQTV